MIFKFPDHLIEKEIHLPDLILKGSVIKRILEDYSEFYLNKNKMSNKKIIKEEISEASIEQKQQLMKLTVDVEGAVFNLYKFAMTSEGVEESLVSMINKLKMRTSEFTRAVEAKYAKNHESNQEIEDNGEKMDLNQRSDDSKNFIESADIVPNEEKETINENKKVSLKENKIWAVTIDLKQDLHNLYESYSIYGFENQKTKKTITKLVESLRSKTDELKENFGAEETNLYEEVIDDISNSDNEQEFEECYERMTEWANKDNKLFLKRD